MLALDTAQAAGNGHVMVTIDVHPTEEEQVARLPEVFAAQHPGWRAVWQRHRLVIATDSSMARPAAGGPLILPLLAHGRGKRMVRFGSLASWQHLGIYGSDAFGALHASLRSLLFNHSPTQMALTIIDHGEIASLYRDVTHLVALPSSHQESVALLEDAARRGAWGQTRPLVLVVLEPDAQLLGQLIGIITRLRTNRTTPLHLLLVQEHLISAGRELYAMLPVLLTSGGHGRAEHGCARDRRAAWLCDRSNRRSTTPIRPDCGSEDIR